MGAPITAFYAAMLTIVVLALGARVAMRRTSVRIGLGEGEDRILRGRVRVHGNAIENIPLAVLLLLLLEIGGAAAAWLHAYGLMLLAGRFLHAWGISHSAGTSVGRLSGMVLTWGAMLAMAVWLVARYLSQV